MYETKVVFEKVGEQNILQSLKLNVSFSKCYPVKQAFVNLFFFIVFLWFKTVSSMNHIIICKTKKKQLKKTYRLFLKMETARMYLLTFVIVR